MTKTLTKNKAIKKDIRSDAIANKNMLLLAAQKAFSEIGPDAQMSDIAKSAGVSRTTLYRHFPDKQSLITDLLEENMRKMNLFASELEPTGEAFFELISYIAHIQVEVNLLTKYLPENIMLENTNRMIEIFKIPVEQAKKANILNKDFDLTQDMPLLFHMIGGILIRVNPSSRKTQVERALYILINGLK